MSISTVLQAYSLLESQGLIEARPQSGYYVRTPAAERLPEPEISSPGRDPSQVSLHELVMMLMADTLNPNLIQLGAALPNPALLPTKKINRILANLAVAKTAPILNTSGRQGWAAAHPDRPAGSQLRLQPFTQ